MNIHQKKIGYLKDIKMCYVHPEFLIQTEFCCLIIITFSNERVNKSKQLYFIYSYTILFIDLIKN